MIKVNMLQDKTVVAMPKGMSLIESVVFHTVLLGVLLGPFALGLYTMYLINTTSFKSIIGF